MPRNAKRGGGAGFGLKYSQKASNDPVDDNFDDGTNQSGPTNGLDAKWTVVQGTAQTAPLYYVGGGTGNNFYDTGANGRIKFHQGGGVSASTNQIFLRQTFTLGLGESLVSSWSLGILGRDQLGAPGWRRYDGLRIGISLSDNSAGPRSGNWVSCGWRADTRVSGNDYSIRITSSSNSPAQDHITTPFLTYSSNAIFRISRRDTDNGYTMHAASGDADAWHQVRSTTYPGSATLTFAWIELWPPTNALSSDVSSACNWIRKGADTWDPWTYQ
jgi:hypothetical protein